MTRYQNATAALMATLLIAVLTPLASAEDSRRGLLDVVVIVDTSASMKDTLPDALRWVAEDVLDSTLIEGDRLRVYATGRVPVKVLDGVVGATGEREQMKGKILAIQDSPSAPGTAKAILDALDAVDADLIRDSGEQRTVWGLLLSSMEVQGTTAGLARRLKYSLTVDHKGWKEVVIGSDMGERIDRSVRDLAKDLSIP